MADLIDRLTGLSEGMTPSRPQILNHEFQAHLWLFGTQKWTGAEAQLGLDLQGQELTQAQQIVTAMNGKNATQKITYGLVVAGVAAALSHVPRVIGQTSSPYFSWSGDQLVVNKARVFTDLEITG